RLGVAVRGPEGMVTTTDFDMVRANGDHEDWQVLDDPEYRDDLRLDPTVFRSSSRRYRLDAAFRELGLDERSTVMVSADDLGGEQTRAFVCGNQ
ncbi:MAG: hypothetical protein ABEN55_19670, partial [Bradymonadaceae bacterium]